MTDKTTTGPDRMETLDKVIEAIHKNTADPSVRLRELGEAFIACADALEGLSAAQARSVLNAAKEII